MDARPTKIDLPKLRDSDIRPLVRQEISCTISDAVVFEELPLCRTARADLAAVNCSLWGYEIKSERDTLNRLPGQISFYDKIFDYSIVIASPKHLKYVRRIVPQRWGIKIVNIVDDQQCLDHVRKPKRNRETCVESLIRLLWKREAVKILRGLKVAVNDKMLVREIWDLLACVPRHELTTAIHIALKARGGSESGSLQK